jgi:sec-independent protein translocase protein TatC
MALVPFSQPKASARPAAYDWLFGNVSILDRLDDFRKRIIRSFLAVAICILISFSFVERIQSFILGPTRRALPKGTTLIYTQPGEAFSFLIQIALITGLVMAMPFIMYQLWRLISPLVPPSVRRFTIPFVSFTTLGFIGGAAFTHYLAFPYMMAFFASFNTPELEFMPKLEPVFGLYLNMLLAMGVVFQMPTVVFFLAKARIVTARFLWRSFRYAFLVIFVIAAVVTPTGDMVTQTIFAAPMVGLYLLSILIAWIFGKSGVGVEPEK